MGFLFLLRCLVLTETWAGNPGLHVSGSHSLRYFDTVQFVRFDSDSESQRAKSQAPWMDKMDQEYWEGEMLLSTVAAQNYRVDLQTLRHYYNQSEGGVHIFQRMCGCEVFPDLKFKRGFKQYAYDGHDYIALDTETYTWTAAVPEPVNTKLKIEAERSLAERKKAYLEETCVLWLHKYLEIGKEMLKRADLPSAQVTCHTDPDGEVTLQCRAQDFYPEEIHLTWPAGDGTFQKWAALGITSGQEGKYTCQVQHEELSEPLTLKWGKDSEEELGKRPSPTSQKVQTGSLIPVLFLLTSAFLHNVGPCGHHCTLLAKPQGSIISALIPLSKASRLCLLSFYLSHFVERQPAIRARGLWK
uniref:Ig-like domain-containing protein n=1 Tax=Vombatus ursinus TaxID=29139 RepID=A0A4X2L7M2_VOMUR